ncbi:MAG TPA: hypothetical protein VHB72_01315 [Candidatus Saccharimonadales bacterium]|nr:hypothetical protein [Candidatus Saccharimonadales bacterium]
MAGFNNSAEFSPPPTPENGSPWAHRLRWGGKIAMGAGAVIIAVDEVIKSPVVGAVGVAVLISGVYGWAMGTFAEGFHTNEPPRN